MERIRTQIIARDRDLLKAARFDRPSAIPVHFNVGAACWSYYEHQALLDLMAAHPTLFPDVEPTRRPAVPNYAPWQRAGEAYVDSWGCRWQTTENGITGVVVEHPLADWSRLADFQPPDPARHWGWGEIDWPAVANKLRHQQETGRLARGDLRHGHTFLTLTYLRGYEQVICDMADDEPRLRMVLEMIEGFNAALVQRYLDLGVQWLGFPEDLGMQIGPMLSPDQFQRYIKPVYRRLMQPVLDAGRLVHMHSDGDIRTLADDLLDLGVHVLNIQDRVNGLDWIASRLKGRVAIDLDLDRQSITRFGTPQDIHQHIQRAVDLLNDPCGGLMLRYGLYPGVPLENVAAVMDAMERYARPA